MQSEIEQLVDEVYAEHEGRVAPKPRHKAAPVCTPRARVNWEAISAEVADAMTGEATAKAAIAQAERNLNNILTSFNIRVDAQLFAASKRPINRIRAIIGR